MTRTAEVETQLTAMANATDRANRPTGLAVIGLVLLGLALLFAIWSGGRFLTARKRLDGVMTARRDVQAILTQIAAQRQASPDLDALFPEKPFIADHIYDTALIVWGLDKNNPEDKARLPAKVGTREPARPLTTNPLIGKTQVDVRIDAQPLEKILQLLNAVQEHEFLGGVFVASINLTPITVGWNATLRFAAYEKAGR